MHWKVAKILGYTEGRSSARLQLPHLLGSSDVGFTTQNCLEFFVKLLEFLRFL